MVASKYDELDDKIPYIRDFWAISSRANFSWDQMVRCENKILNWLNWDLMVISPENFTSALLSFGILFSDEGQTADKAKSLRMYTEMFTDIALQSMEMQ